MTTRILFQDLPHSDAIKSDCERSVEALRDEFPETSKYEITLTHDGGDHETHVHVTGKQVELAARAKHRDLHEAVIEAFERARRQLRKHHDKQIDASRRRCDHDRTASD